MECESFWMDLEAGIGIDVGGIDANLLAESPV